MLGFAGPAAIIAVLVATYLVAPDFYLRHVLEYQHREYQAVEMTTVASAAAAGVLLLVAAARLWMRRPSLADLPGSATSRWFASAGPTLLVLSVGLASISLAGEEVSWGQTFANWGIPENQKADPTETNLHNNGIPLQTLGQVFLGGIFFVLPALWAFRDHPRLPQALRLPASFRPAVAETPVIFAAAFAFSWKLVKEIYVGLFGKAEGDTLYWNFIEQINEQRELLIAFALLVYALHRVRAASGRGEKLSG